MQEDLAAKQKKIAEQEEKLKADAKVYENNGSWYNGACLGDKLLRFHLYFVSRSLFMVVIDC